MSIQKKFKDRKMTFIFLMFIVVLILIIAFQTNKQVSKQVTRKKSLLEKKESKEKRAPIVSIQKLVREDFNDIITGVTGKIDVKRAKLGFQINGIVATTPYDKGDLVKQGNILAELDKEDLDLKLEYKKNSLKNAKIELAKAQKILNDNKGKAKTGYILENKIKDYELDVELKQGKVEAAELEIKAAEKNITKAELRAPFEGVVLERKVEVGESVSNNREAFILLDINNTFADIEISEQKIEKIEPGQDILLKTSIYKEPIKGKIHKVVPAVQGKAMVLSARAKLQPSNQTLVAGMFGEVDIIVFKKKDSIVVPIKALFKENNDVFVFIYDIKKNIAKKRIVKAGYITDERAVINEGLKVGNQVIIETTDPLKDGIPVKVES